MTKNQKSKLARILISFALLIVAAFLPLEGAAKMISFLIPYAIIGYDVLYKAFRNILKGQIFDENFLMAIATIGAFFISEYAEGVAVLLFYQVGNLFESYAVGKSRRSIAELMDIRPDFANIEKDGELFQIDPEEIEIGDIIVIKPGERVPLDGEIIEGSSYIDSSALTGESVPRSVSKGDEIISGTVNNSGLLRARVTKPFGESTVSRILDLVENSSAKKAKSENFITKFARYYTPAVVISAVLLAVLPPLLFNEPWLDWVYQALTFLVISCPCALVISVPLSFFGGIGGASKRGILVKGGNYLEALSEVETIAFDKTGTLTKGVFRLQKICPEGMSETELLEIAALAESFSDHPIAHSIIDSYNEGRRGALTLDKNRVTDIQEIAGRGLSVLLDGKRVFAGNAKLMQEEEIQFSNCDSVGTVVHIAREKQYLGHIIIADELKDDAAEAIAELKRCGIRHTVLLTGDARPVAEAIAAELGVTDVFSELLPEDKVEHIEKMLEDKEKFGKVAFVGDGINDAPVLSRVDIGLSMGALGSDAAIEASDIVLMDDKPSKIPLAIKIAKKTVRIVRQNIVFALGVKAIVLLLGVLKIANMWWAVFADVGVSVLAILNAMRALKSDYEK
ncbi:heavy metal translocating P-type ATPase [Clostridiaceae bacterium OttesenSCG-928-D20]|nr:heavy metal translocating P-type ATPase [Clostridiaceae bacterium OttesenSCG-928-D20]